MPEKNKRSRQKFMIYISFSLGAYVVRTSCLNDNHSCQLFGMGLRDNKQTTHLIMANMSCAVAFLQSCFYVRLHGQTEPFSSCIILQSCSSFFFCLHGQPEVFAIDHLLQFYFSLQLIFITSLQSFESCLALFLMVFCF